MPGFVTATPHHKGALRALHATLFYIIGCAYDVAYPRTPRSHTTVAHVASAVTCARLGARAGPAVVDSYSSRRGLAWSSRSWACGV